MRSLTERFVLLPFSAGCISESSIPVVTQPAKRSKLNISSRTHEEERDDEGEESFFGENLKTALPRFQKLFKNLSQLFVYKDIGMEREMGLEISFPRDVKHVTHIGFDGCTSSMFPSFPFKQLELAITSETKTADGRSMLQIKRDSHDAAIAQ